MPPFRTSPQKQIARAEPALERRQARGQASARTSANTSRAAIIASRMMGTPT